MLKLTISKSTRNGLKIIIAIFLIELFIAFEGGNILVYEDRLDHANNHNACYYNLIEYLKKYPI